MHQHPRFSTSRTCRNNDATCILIGYDLFLACRQFAKQLLILPWGKVSLYLVHSFALKIFRNKSAIVHLKIVFNKLLRRIVIFHHHICILAHDMYLLYSLAIKLIKHAIVVFTKSRSVIFHALNVHGIVYHKKPTIQLKCTNLSEIEQ